MPFVVGVPESKWGVNTAKPSIFDPSPKKNHWVTLPVVEPPALLPFKCTLAEQQKAKGAFPLFPRLVGR